MSGHLSPSFSATLRVHLSDSPGSFARLAQAVGEAGGLLGAIDIVRVEPGVKVRDVTVEATGAERVYVTHGQVEPLVRFLAERGLDALPMETEFEGEKGAEEAGA